MASCMEYMKPPFYFFYFFSFGNRLKMSLRGIIFFFLILNFFFSKNFLILNYHITITIYSVPQKKKNLFFLISFIYLF